MSNDPKAKRENENATQDRHQERERERECQKNRQAGDLADQIREQIRIPAEKKLQGLFLALAALLAASCSGLVTLSRWWIVLAFFAKQQLGGISSGQELRRGTFASTTAVPVLRTKVAMGYPGKGPGAWRSKSGTRRTKSDGTIEKHKRLGGAYFVRFSRCSVPALHYKTHQPNSKRDQG